MSTGGVIRDGGPGADDVKSDAAFNNAASSLYRVRPNHGVVFVEFDLPGELLGKTQTWLHEEIVDDEYGQRPVLLPLEREAISDGVAWHPVTFMPLGPQDTLWLSGYDGVEPFLGTWIPLPFLRLVTDRTRSTYLDSGPSNWVRLYLVPPEGDLRDARRIKAVLAIDTRLTDTSRLESPRYLGPTIEDASFGSTFALAAEADELSDFLSENWIDAWLRQAFEGAKDQLDLGTEGPERATTCQLEHVARYLALLSALKNLSPIPQLRFYNVANRETSPNTEGVDFVVDVSGSDINSFIISQKATKDGGTRKVTRPLGVRELSRPDRVHDHAVPAYVEFDAPAFGDARLSRLSGRSDACSWPSLVRIGEEAKRLGLRANATDGVTGASDFLRHACDATLSAKVWRLSTDSASGERAGPMATSAALDHLSEDGRLLGTEDGGLPAVRPKFSKSSLISLFISELILHAVSQVSAPKHHDADDDGAQLADISTVKIALPVAITADEQRAILERARDGIDLVWRLQGWDRDQTGMAPRKPRLHASVGADLAVQLLYLEEEVETRFGGDFKSFAAAAGRMQSGSAGMGAFLRVASIELGQFQSTLVVAEYDVDNDGTISPSLSRAERSSPGIRAMTRAILERHIMPAIERELDKSQLPSAASFLREITGRAPVVWQMDDGDFSTRLEHKVLQPAAEALLQLYSELPPDPAHGIEHASFATLVELGGGEIDLLAAHFDAAAVRAGAQDFDLASVRIPLNQRAIRKIVRGELDSSLANVLAELRPENCDLVVLAGEYAGLQDVRDVVFSHLPICSHRLVTMPSEQVEAAKRSEGRDHTRLLGILGIFDQHRLPAAGDFSYQGGPLPDSTRADHGSPPGPRALPDYNDGDGPNIIDVERNTESAFGDILKPTQSSEKRP
ncbi:MAG: virulence factor SrfB [Alphaproteobacteria bacterium]|nr:virulence factor SrfB [Alphaproteobacteria bacterium]